MRYFARHADPEADERGYTKNKDREYLDVSPTLGGYHVSGFLTEEHGLTLTTALGSVTGAPTPGDDRTPGQRRAQALADLARVVLDNGHTGTGASVRPHLSVTVSWTELQSLATKHRITTRTEHAGGASPTSATSVKTPAVFTESGSAVPTSLLRRIACDSQTTRIVFGPDSQILHVGRAQRTVTGQLRRAVIARDKHCVLGGCDQPPARCEVHHAQQHWADGGHTSVTNAALLWARARARPRRARGRHGVRPRGGPWPSSATSPASTRSRPARNQASASSTKEAGTVPPVAASSHGCRRHAPVRSSRRSSSDHQVR